MNAVLNLISVAGIETLSFLHLESRFKLSFKSCPQGVALLPRVLALVMIIAWNVLLTTAQSETVPKPAGSPTSSPAINPGTSEKTSQLTTGQIKGRLVSSDGQLLTNANVTVQSLTGTPAAKPTRPDAEGRFVFEDLTPGSYILIGTAPGYIDQSWTNGNPTEWPRHLIGANVRINMIRGGVITGLVTSAKGVPLVGVPVHATQLNDAASSFFSFSGAGISETDDRGIYRIYGLLPGQYIVNTGANGPFGQYTASGFDYDVPTYYPSSPRDTAIPVSVRSGDETTGIDIKYKGTAGHSISGVVVGNIEASAGSAAVTIALAHAGTSSVQSIAIVGALDPRRAFSFYGVADGEYDLLASYRASPTANASMGTKRVSVRGSDVSGLELRLASLGSISGMITLDSIKPEDKCDKRGSQVIETILRLRPDEPRKTANQPLKVMYSGLGQLNEKGEYVQHNLEAAKYRLDIRLPSESWYIRAINLPAPAARPTQRIAPAALDQRAAANPGLNVWQGLVTIKSGENLGGVSIMVGQDAAGLSGRVKAEGTVIREGTRAHLVPVEREEANNVLRYSQTIVKTDGSFAFTNIAPGRYFILSRVEQPTEPDASTRPIAWDAAARAKLRHEAEAASIVVELKPCQRVVDYALKVGG